MIKYLMRKTVYKKVDSETQERLFQLTSRQYIIQFFCFMSWVVIFIIPFIPLFIVDLCEDVKFELSTQIAIIVFLVIYFVACVLFLKFFGELIFILSHQIAEKVYFWRYTTKGKALIKKDFEIIRNNDYILYDFISSQKCRGYCYSTCFKILELLKRGEIEFLAVKKFSFEKDDKKDDGRNYTMHVLYINNGWAFDTYSQCQYPVDEIHKIYRAKIYKTCTFDDIRNKSYYDFKAENESKIKKWCNNNDCSYFS